MNTATTAETSREPVAVVGMGCRLPGAANPAEFWALLIEGRNAVTEVPSDRWDMRRYHHPRPGTKGRTYSRWGGFLADVDHFDPDFFGLSPRESAEMDPQQRLALEVAWEALADAGYGPDLLAGSDTGVYMGVGNSDYSRLRARHRETMNVYSGTGAAHSIVANRISYLLDLRGPSIAVDTACSASLVAVHLAVQSLLTGESDLVLAGGVNMILDPDVYVAFAQARYLSPDGRCKTFDARANGYARGEGCGVVVLKRLADARVDGDRVLAVLRGSAVNQDGRSNGLNAPNPQAQQQVIRKALRSAGVQPCDIGYVETHGTGTVLGDPIEVKSLGTVLGEGRPAHSPCRLGAVKANIGHLEAAAGIAGFIKTVLVLNQRIIPPNRHLERLNPELELAGSGFEIPTEPQKWLAEQPLAAVSSFGFGGTNAHVILGAAPDPGPSPEEDQRPEHVLCLSAHNERLLAQACDEYARHLRATPLPIADIAYTANTGRMHFPYRVAVRAGSASELAARLAVLAAGGDVTSAVRGRAGAGPPRIGFLFTGRGSHPGSGRQLYEIDPGFRQVVDHCEEQARGLLDSSPRDHLRGLTDSSDPAAVRVSEFTLEYGLAVLLMRWGIRAHAVMGHRLGEYVAACVAGVVDVKTALTLVVERERSLAALPVAGPVTALRDEKAVPALLTDELDPPQDDLQKITRTLVEDGCDAFIAFAPFPSILDANGAAAAAAELPGTDTHHRGEPDWSMLLRTLSELYVRGAPVDWRAFYADRPRNRVPLPGPVYERRRLWFRPSRTADDPPTISGR